MSEPDFVSFPDVPVHHYHYDRVTDVLYRREYDGSWAIMKKFEGKLTGAEADKKPAGDTGRHADPDTDTRDLITRGIARRIRNGVPLVTDYHRGGTAFDVADGDKIKHIEVGGRRAGQTLRKSLQEVIAAQKPHPDSLIYNPVTREFE